jgi:hypothetical protein
MSRYEAPGSLRHILTSNPRKRLFLPPGCWTAEHLDLLDCRVVRPVPVDISALREHESFAARKIVKSKTVGSAVSRLPNIKCIARHFRDEPIEHLLRAIIPLLGLGKNAADLKQ